MESFTRSLGDGQRHGSLLRNMWTLLLLLSLVASTQAGCVRFADERKINKLFSDGGPGTKVVLCQRESYNINNPIMFTAKDQELTTEGQPMRDEDKATIVVRGGNRGVAVQGDCRRCARVSLSHLIIDGSRPVLGRIPNPDYVDKDEIQGLDLRPRHKLSHLDLAAGTALVLLGNNEGQSVRHCRLKDPRGWTAIQVREGDNLSCTGAVIEDNVIGPSGEEWIEDIDGEAPELSPLGRPLADGISLACKDSVVQRNTIIDATEAGINIYCAPGSLISSNHVIASSRTQMGGILMIDPSPFDANYTDVRVVNNTLEAEEGALMRVAIGIGSAIWSDDIETVLYGGTVSGNHIRGLGMGYGIAAAGVRDFSVIENESLARHGGERGERCLVPVEDDDPAWDKFTDEEKEYGVVRNPIPQAFVRNHLTIEGGEWQEDFVPADFAYLVCLDSDPDDKPASRPAGDGNQGDGGSKADSAPAPPPRPVPKIPEEEAEEKPKTVMDDIFYHSQARMLEAIAKLGREVDVVHQRMMLHGSVHHDAIADRDVTGGQDGQMLLSTLSLLSDRIKHLETERQAMKKSLQGMRGDVVALQKGVDKFETHESSVLEEVIGLMNAHAAEGQQKNLAADSSQSSAHAKAGKILHERLIASHHVAWWKPFAYIFGFQGVVVLAGLAWRRWRRQQVKGIKRI